MSRIQKQVSLPSEYWEVVDSLIGKRFIRSRGDALMTIIEKVYPILLEDTLSTQKVTQMGESYTTHTLKDVEKGKIPFDF